MVGLTGCTSLVPAMVSLVGDKGYGWRYQVEGALVAWAGPM